MAAGSAAPQGDRIARRLEAGRLNHLRRHMKAGGNLVWAVRIAAVLHGLPAQLSPPPHDSHVRAQPVAARRVHFQHAACSSGSLQHLANLRLEVLFLIWRRSLDPVALRVVEMGERLERLVRLEHREHLAEGLPCGRSQVDAYAISQLRSIAPRLPSYDHSVCTWRSGGRTT